MSDAAGAASPARPGPPGDLRVGLVSDTHGRVRPELFAVLEGVDRILHAGDVGSPSVLDELAVLAPVTAVWGNTDGFDVRAVTRERAGVELAGRRVDVVHGHQLGSPTPERVLEAYPEADVVVFGHTHRPVVREIGGRLAVNPGAAGPARFGLRPSVAILTFAGGAFRAEIVEL